MQSAPKPCGHPGCGVLVRDGTNRCTDHKRADAKALDARRGTAHERGYTSAWQKARAHYLRAHPLCARHEARGEVVEAVVVDHKTPHRGDKALFWDSNNWQPLCKRCHDVKTATEDGAFGRSHTPALRDLAGVVDVEGRWVDDLPDSPRLR